MKLTGKTAVVTGGNRGIGLELTRQLAAKGNKVIATARKPEEAKELQALAASSGGQVAVTQLDVTSPESVAAWAAGLKDQATHVDLLLNNAGVLTASGLGSVTAEEMWHNFTVNAVGPLLVTQQLVKQRLLGWPSGGASLVANMTSKMGSVEDNGSGSYYAYRASKAALNIVTKSLSIDLAGDDITCVLLHPGYVRTDMTGGGGLIDTKQCAAGLLAVLQSGKPLNGMWYDYTGKVVPW